MLPRFCNALQQIKFSAYPRAYARIINSRGYATREAQDPPENLRKGFEQFQRDDGVPVYLKAGLRDRLLYLLTLGLIIVGVGNSFYMLLGMAFPPKRN